MAYLAWAISLTGVVGFGRGTLLLALALVGLASFFAARRRPSDRSAQPFWVPAAIFIVIRAAVPEVLGAEKFMDLAFMNSLTRSGQMPPADPWMSGFTINYYYWGYLLAAAMAKLSGVPTAVAYNLSVATFAAYSFAAAACLALRLSRGRVAAGIWAGIA